MRVTMLGSGASAGVPRLGPDWGTCDPTDPRNRRRRTSLLVEHAGVRVLVDTGPDLLAQLNDARVDRLDAVLWTHDHADHTHGIDELRQLTRDGRRLTRGHASVETADMLARRFPYMFGEERGYGPFVDLEPTGHGDRIVIGELAIRPFTQVHGPIDTLGFRFEADDLAVAYSTDINGLPAESETFVSGLDLWIVDAQRRERHPTHSHLAQTLRWIEHFEPRAAWLTHLDLTMDYATLAQELPAAVEPGHDMLTMTLGEGR